MQTKFAVMSFTNATPEPSTTTERGAAWYVSTRNRWRCLPFDDFLRGIQRSVDPTAPRFTAVRS